MWAKIKAGLAMVLALVTALCAVWFRGRATGRTEAEQAAATEDLANAREIEKRVDAVRARPADPDYGMLKKYGRFRD